MSLLVDGVFRVETVRHRPRIERQPGVQSSHVALPEASHKDDASIAPTKVLVLAVGDHSLTALSHEVLQLEDIRTLQMIRNALCSL